MIRFLLLVLALAAPSCVPQSGAVVSDDLALSGTYGPQAPISVDPRDRLMGHVIRATRSGEDVRALVISHRSDGITRVFAREAWSNGTQLPYRATHRLLDGCTHGHCLDHSVGMIFLSEPLFAHARQAGLDVYLVGRQGNFSIFAPPRLFALPEP